MNKPAQTDLNRTPPAAAKIIRYNTVIILLNINTTDFYIVKPLDNHGIPDNIKSVEADLTGAKSGGPAPTQKL